ncbi:MAG: undecaprenyl-diphosphate phosphatase [Rhodovibrionaceae bacterium]
MPLLHLLILAAVQGITEFLPISSSGHLVLTWEIFDSLGQAVEQDPADRLILDIAVHVGTLLAVCVYFWRDLGTMIAGGLRLLAGRVTPGGRLLLYVVAATLPLIGAGVALKTTLALELRGIEVIAWATLGFGVLLYLADRMGMLIRRMEHMGLGSALVIGLAQILALIPGTSRSGITMTAARFLGFERAEAARFSMLLAIPAILGAGVLAGLDLRESGDLALRREALVGGLLAFIAALMAIAVLMQWLKRASFTPFVIYRILLGGLLLALVYGPGLTSASS